MASRKKAAARPAEPASFEERPGVRFSAMVRADWTADGKSTFAFTSHVGARALWLRRPKDLAEGQKLELKLSWSSQARPLALEALVCGPPDEGGTVLVELVADERGMSAWRKFVEQQCVARLEESVSRSLRSVDKVLDLGAWYEESGRQDDALALYRKAMLANP